MKATENTTTALTLAKDDIKKIGHTMWEEGGNLSIICDAKTANIEELMLRSILELFGYSITEVTDFQWENGTTGIRILTNMPWDEFKQI